jgi:hypothetical protein
MSNYYKSDEIVHKIKTRFWKTTARREKLRNQNGRLEASSTLQLP